LLDDHSVSCWGKDGFFSPIDYGNLPLPISGLSEVVEVYAGGDNSCAIEADHTVKCWGSNLGGQLGEDREGNEFSPVVVHGLPGSE
jgi:alpha-tubulin suppressor-like RCC1 family protein